MLELDGFTFEMFRVVQDRFFLISFILGTIRSHNEIAIALSSSGIAATLLEGGRRAHSNLKSPLNIQRKDVRPPTFRKTQQWQRFCSNVC